MQPVPALVMAWRYTWSRTSPAANTPGTLVWVAKPFEAALRDDVAVFHLQLALEDFGVGRMADGDEAALAARCPGCCRLACS